MLKAKTVVYNGLAQVSKENFTIIHFLREDLLAKKAFAVVVGKPKFMRDINFFGKSFLVLFILGSASKGFYALKNLFSCYVIRKLKMRKIFLSNAIYSNLGGSLGYGILTRFLPKGWIFSLISY